MVNTSNQLLYLNGFCKFPVLEIRANFETLNNSVDSLVEDHSVANIIALVGNEIPIDTGVSYQEAQSASKLIIDSHLNPMLLDPVVFLKSDGNEVKIGDSSDKTQRSLISHIYGSVAICTVRQLPLESLNYQIFHFIFVYISLSTRTMIQQVS